MEKQRSIKVLSVVALIVAVLGLTVAFAALSETLNITGTGSVKGNTEDAEGNKTWDIHFEELSSTLNGLATQNGNVELQTTSLTGINVSLSAPGDSATYTFNVVNNGKLNAQLGTLTKNVKPICESNANNTNDATSVCNNLTYTFKYSNGTDVAQGDTLNIGETKNLVLKIAYDGEFIPTDDVTISGLDITMNYVQAE